MADAWLADGSTRRQKITIQGTNLDANVTHFPLYVEVVPGDTPGGATMTEAANDGTDIRFTESDGTTLLDHELEYWSGGGGSAVTAHFWVSNAGWSIESDGSTYIYIYYGSGGADGENATGVWDANFQAVYHMVDLNDSTSNGNNLTGQNSPTSGQTGKVYQCYDFELDDSEYADLASGVVTVAPITFEAWVNLESAVDTAVLNVGDGTAYSDGWFLRVDESGGNLIPKFVCTDAGDVTASTSNYMSLATWH
jgi:hypothetical protein